MAHAAPRVTVVLEQAVGRDRDVTGVRMVFIFKCRSASAMPLSRLEFPSEHEHRASPGPKNYGGQSGTRKEGGHNRRARRALEPWETSWDEGHSSTGLEGLPVNL